MYRNDTLNDRKNGAQIGRDLNDRLSFSSKSYSQNKYILKQCVKNKSKTE